jgi:hypothetical protein
VARTRSSATSGCWPVRNSAISWKTRAKAQRSGTGFAPAAQRISRPICDLRRTCPTRAGPWRRRCAGGRGWAKSPVHRSSAALGWSTAARRWPAPAGPGRPRRSTGIQARVVSWRRSSIAVRTVYVVSWRNVARSLTATGVRGRRAERACFRRDKN